MGPRGLALLVLAATLAPAGVAHAFDVQLDADTSFSIYEVRSQGARAFMARRRLLSRVGLRLSHDLTEPDDEGSAIRVLADVQLRLEQDFGETCLVDRDLCVDAIDSNDLSAYQPLATDTRLDVPGVWVGLAGLPLGLSVRVGRQLVLDTIGFARYDGGAVDFAPVRWFRLQAFGGLLVRGTSLLGTPRSDPQGSIRVDSPVDVPFVAPPVDTWVIGVSANGGPGRELQASVGYRYMWESDGQVLSRLSLALSSQPVDGLRMDATGVLDLFTTEIIEARGTVRIGDDTLSGYGQVSRHVPRFDPGTIWSWFSVAPIDQAELGASWTVTDDLSLGGSLRGRRAELGGEQGEDLDAGFDAWLRARWEGFRLEASGFAWSGSLGPLAGVSLGVRRPILGFVELGADVSVWHFDDPLRDYAHGAVVSTALEGRVRITDETLVFVELQHAASDAVGHRFRGIIAIRVETWR
ncbi:MAG: hypothetical protein AB7S26_09380 [Sandaracinaceae bacterium]